MQFIKKNLEQIFADDFTSSIFPILAEIYFQNKEYERSLKICKIGLSYNSNNAIGNYILSKIYYVDKKYEKAESILKKIIQDNPHHVKAIIKLAKIQKKLKRSSKKIQETINLGLKVGIKHQYFQAPQRKNTNKKNQRKKYLKEAMERPGLESVSINKSMATKTMYQIMVKQKKYDVALSVLHVMQNNSKNLRFVNTEIKKIKNLLNQKD